MDKSGDIKYLLPKQGGEKYFFPIVASTNKRLSVSDDTIALCQSMRCLCNILIDLRSDIAVYAYPLSSKNA
jgi:hypothetical protein